MKRLNLTLLITIFSILFTAMSGILSNAISLPPQVKSLALPLLGLCVAFMVFFAVMPQIQGKKSPQSLISLEFIQASHPFTRNKMLQLVERSWIHGYLEPSLFTKQVLPIQVFCQPAAVEAAPRPSSVSLLSNSSLSMQNLYDLSDDGLLILGSSGAGKTTALLELTRTLLDHAQSDDKQPIPVVFSLSSWDVKQAPLHEWLAHELQVRYEVSQRRAQFWIETDQLLPLLDDFDMVADTCRTACIQAINGYRQQHGLIPLVVCSRSEEYLAQPVRLHLQHAVVLQSLSSALITSYVAQESQKLTSIRIVLRKHPQLLSYVRLPRHLDLLARFIVEHTTSVQEFRSLLRSGNFHLVEQKLLHKYVQQQLQHAPLSSRVTSSQVSQTLHWLAIGMKAHHQISFALEELQPDWLPDEQLRQAAQQQVQVWIWIIFLVVGELNGILLSQSGRIPFFTISFILAQVAYYRFLRLIKNMPLVQKSGLDMSLLEGISWIWKHKRERLLNVAFRRGCIYLLVFGGGAMLLGILFSVWKGLTFGLLSGFLIGLFAVISFFAGSSAGALSIGLMKRHSRRPGDGVWRLARYGMLYSLLIGGGIGGLAFAITNALQFGLKFSSGFTIALGISCGLNMWLLCSLINGGYMLIQHYVCRSLLKRAAFILGDLPALLQIAVQCRLLCLVNSSFMFPHRWLRDYFASYGKNEPSSV